MQLAEPTGREIERCDRDNRREGVALIIVLGLLALMILMGVSFAIYMRTGRVAAGNFRNDVRARQLLHVALNRAMQDIDANLTTNLYPPWEYLLSKGSPDISGATNPPVLDWMPIAAFGTNQNIQPQWKEEQYGGKMEGRVGYLVLNCSGFLDANYAGGRPVTQRAGGTNANEIQLRSLAGEVADETKIGGNRSYETLQEFGAFGKANGTLAGTPAHFVTFSAFPTGSAVSVAGNVASLVARQAAIIAGFTNAGFNVTQAGILFTNLCDYVDADVIPGNLGGTVPAVPDGPFVEPVWMFNEVQASNNVTFTSNGTNYLVAGQWFIDGEVWFPFLGDPAPDRTGFTLTLVITFTNDAGSAIYGPASNPMTITAPIVPGGSDFWVLSRRGPILGGTTASIPAGSKIQMGATVKATISKGGADVDVVTNLVLSYNVPLVAAGANYSGGGGADLECDDARMNYQLAGRWKAPVNNAPTLRAINSQSVSLMNGDWRDGDWAMFVRNAPVDTPGELGYLFFGAPGETVRLYPHGNNVARNKMHTVLDAFTTEAAGGSRFIKGRVNLNTRNPEVMDCVFDGLPMDYPHGPKANRVSGALLQTITDTIMARRQTTEFRTLSDLGLVDWRTILPAASGSDLDRESLIRNAAGLMNVRQNFFVIVLYAQTTKTVPQMPDKSVVSGVRAIAEVWRDPAVPVGQSSYFLRTFKLLNE